MNTEYVCSVDLGDGVEPITGQVLAMAQIRRLRAAGLPVEAKRRERLTISGVLQKWREDKVDTASALCKAFQTT